MVAGLWGCRAAELQSCSPIESISVVLVGHQLCDSVERLTVTDAICLIWQKVLTTHTTHSAT